MKKLAYFKCGMAIIEFFIATSIILLPVFSYVATGE